MTEDEKVLKQQADLSITLSCLVICVSAKKLSAAIAKLERYETALKKLAGPFERHESYLRLGYDSEREPGVDKIIAGAFGEHECSREIAHKALTETEGT